MMCNMHTKLLSLTISLLITSLIALPYSAKAYYWDAYEAFFASGPSQCGIIDPYGAGRLLSLSENCSVVIRGSESLKSKLRYWVTFRPIGNLSERKISPVYFYKNKTRKNSDFLRFSMKGTGQYYIYFDENNNGYPDDYKVLGYFYKKAVGGN